MNEEEIAHEFGMKRNLIHRLILNQLLLILEKEFVENNEFLNLNDLCKV